MIEDDDAAMPDGWQENEPTLVPDPTSERPSDWWVNTIIIALEIRQNLEN